nr:amidohydrolase family protein [Propylenella binzhouense]
MVAAIEPRIESEAPRADGTGCLAFGGFVETHVHLDKACILDRCRLRHGTLEEAIALTARAKAGFTVEDVRARAAAVIEKAVTHGTMRMRSFVEVDPRAGFRSLQALLALRADYGWALDLDLCAFAQEGLTNEPETAGMLDEALRMGATSLGGCPYTDPDPVAHVAAIFEIAERHGVDVDFHADFDLDPAHSILPEIAAQTRARGYAGRVSVGHVTKLAAMAPEAVAGMAETLAEAGVAVTVLPATDLFLGGRAADRLAPRGVAPAYALARRGVLASVASNNILNPFTPFGDASLCRMANLYANVAHLAREEDLAAVFRMVSGDAARQLGAPHGIRPGGPADIVLLDAPDPAAAVRTVAPALAGWKAGRMTFRRGRPELFPPAPPARAAGA